MARWLKRHCNLHAPPSPRRLRESISLLLLTTSARRSGNRAVSELFVATSSRQEAGPRGNWEPANPPIGGRELEQRGPSAEGSRQIIAVKDSKRVPRGLARSRPRTQPRSAGPESPARQGLQRKVGTRDQALRGLTPALVVRIPTLPCWQGTWANSFISPALTGSSALKWEP